MSELAKRTRLRALLVVLMVGAMTLAVSGCSDSKSSSPNLSGSNNPGDSNSPDLSRKVDDSRVASSDRIRNWVGERLQFNRAFMVSGSQAQASYIKLLEGQLRNTCLEDARPEPFKLTTWFPKKTELTVAMNDGTRQIMDLSGYIPRSGNTGANGVKAKLFLLPELQAQAKTVLLDGKPIGKTIKNYDVAGKLVVVRLPSPVIPIKALKGLFYNVNDPGDTLPDNLATNFFPALVAVPQIQAALEAQGAAGMIAVQPLIEQAADHMYAPFPKKIGNLPGVYLAKNAGNKLVKAIQSANAPLSAQLVLNADVDHDATVDNLTGYLPGSSSRTVVLSTHTDSVNANEEDGSAAILAMVHYFCSIPKNQRPVSLRIVMHGGHFAGNAGLSAYVDRHKDRIEKNTIAAMELEHLGALEWDKQPGQTTYGLTGKIGTNLLTLSSDSAPIVSEGIAFGDKFKRSIVAPRKLIPFGAGDEWVNETTLIQYITGENYLLNYDFPDSAVFTRFIDYDLMRREIKEFIQMVLDLGNTDASHFDRKYKKQ